MNRLTTQIQKIQKEKGKLFCAFLTVGYPSLAATRKLVESFEQNNVDILELGFPFSDPLADGPTIQYSSEQALKKGVKLQDAFQLVRSLRKAGSKIPIVFFGYFNPILHYGLKRFVDEASRSGFDAVLVPDLPPEEEPEFQKLCVKKGLSQVFLVAPTTCLERAAKIAKHSKGFLYYVSLRGVTGTRQSVPSDIQASVRSLRAVTRKPVLIGFGVSSPEQARELSKLGEGVIVGSAIIEKIRKANGEIKPAISFVKKMVLAVKGRGAQNGG